MISFFFFKFFPIKIFMYLGFYYLFFFANNFSTSFECISNLYTLWFIFKVKYYMMLLLDLVNCFKGQTPRLNRAHKYYQFFYNTSCEFTSYLIPLKLLYIIFYWFHTGVYCRGRRRILRLRHWRLIGHRDLR